MVARGLVHCMCVGGEVRWGWSMFVLVPVVISCVWYVHTYMCVHVVCEGVMCCDVLCCCGCGIGIDSKVGSALILILIFYRLDCLCECSDSIFDLDLTPY